MYFICLRLDIPCDLVFPLSRHSNLKLTEENIVSLSNNGCAGKYVPYVHTN